MATRRSRTKPREAIGNVAGGLFFCWAVIQFIQDDGDVVFGALSVAALLMLIGFASYTWLKKKAAESLAEKIATIIDRHLEILVRRRAQLITLDAYGKPQTQKWDQEVKHFITEHIAEDLSAAEREALKAEQEDVARHIDERASSATRDRPAFQGFSWDMSPREFEAFCMEKLSRAGWTATLTAAGADQGVDVIADKNGVRFVLQCKMWAQPISNAAVQEIAAARAHEKAHYAAVVTNSSYTSAAHQLATTNNVLLLHFSELESVETRLSQLHHAQR